MTYEPHASGNDVIDDVICHDRVDWLVRRQRVLLCRSQPELTSVIRQAATQAVAECRHQFNEEIWNCPLDGTENTPVGDMIAALKKIDKSGTSVCYYEYIKSSTVLRVPAQVAAS